VVTSTPSSSASGQSQEAKPPIAERGFVADWVPISSAPSRSHKSVQRSATEPFAVITSKRRSTSTPAATASWTISFVVW